MMQVLFLSIMVIIINAFSQVGNRALHSLSVFCTNPSVDQSLKSYCTLSLYHSSPSLFRAASLVFVFWGPSECYSGVVICIHPQHIQSTASTFIYLLCDFFHFCPYLGIKFLCPKIPSFVPRKS